ncbi:MAG: hypothetical protein JWO92_999 [Chitinophagaceae bacterium]|nr:hypothetical protein [Chitinophagaceae bacterium]
MKRFFLTVFTFLIIFSASACEICGCGVGNFYLGLLPHFNSKFFGVRYQYTHYHTQLASDATQFSNDYYKTVELWGGINIGSKLQLLAFVPYHINKQFTDDGIKTQNGIGDVSLLLNYNLLHSRNAGKRLVEHQLWIGGGVKLPTGKNNIDVNDPLVNPGDVNSQTGSGSTDILLNASYDVSINKFGLNTSVNYKINTDNKTGYQFGNRFTANTFAYYKLRAMGLGIAPNVGLLYENAAINKLSKAAVVQTGGNLTSVAGGIEMNFNKIALGANVQLPVAQNFAEGQTQAKVKGLVHLTFAL